MTDLHTHILPGMDDGAENADKSLAMLKMEKNQGVTTVVLTPHFYRDRENPKRFLRRRQESALLLAKRLRELSDEERNALPRIILGAEVTWWQDIADWEELPQMCIGETKNILIELPFVPWNGRMIDKLYSFTGSTGLTPVLAHMDRYLNIQPPELIDEVLSLGFPVQVGADVLQRPLARGGALNLIRYGQAHIIASDCHDCARRQPRLVEALQLVRRKFGDDVAEDMLRYADVLAGVADEENSAEQ